MLNWILYIYGKIRIRTKETISKIFTHFLQKAIHLKMSPQHLTLLEILQKFH